MNQRCVREITGGVLPSFSFTTDVATSLTVGTDEDSFLASAIRVQLKRFYLVRKQFGQAEQVEQIEQIEQV